MIAGSAAYALATGKFRWEGFRDADDTGMHILGGILMGFGGITALGCTIGQGITGLLHAGAGFDPDLPRHRRRLGGDDEGPVLANGRIMSAAREFQPHKRIELLVQ